MKKKLLWVIVMLFMLFHHVEAASIKLNKTSLSLYVGKTYTLKVKGTKKKATYQSSDTAIVTVSSKGVVKGVLPGSATITVKAAGKTLTCKVKVSYAPALSAKTMSLTIGKTKTLSMKYTTAKVTWKSANKKIATVTSKGVVKGIKAGKTTIKAIVKKKTYKCTVTVLKKPTLSQTNVTLPLDGTVTLKINNATSVVWRVEDESIASVSSSGVVKALASGTTHVVADVEGTLLSCEVTVVVPQLLTKEVTLEKGEKTTLKLDQQGLEMTWSSEDSSVASVTQSGVVTAKSTGIVTVTAKNGGYSCTCTVTVLPTQTNNRIMDLMGSRSKCLIAHMGYCAAYPRNTTVAFEAAGKNDDFWGIETDLHDTKDGKIICMHGFKVDETTNGTGSISSLTLEEIRELTVTYGNNIENYPDLKVPTFEEYLEICKTYDKVAVIDIKSMSKSSSLKTIVDIIEDYHMEKRCILTSGAPAQLMTIKDKYNADIAVMPLYKTMTHAKLNTWASYSNVGMYQEHTNITADDVAKAEELNYAYGAYTLTSSSQITKLKGYGVRMFCVNKPL